MLREQVTLLPNEVSPDPRDIFPVWPGNKSQKVRLQSFGYVFVFYSFVTNLSFLPVIPEKVSTSFIESHSLHSPHGSSLSASCFLR